MSVAFYALLLFAGIAGKVGTGDVPVPGATVTAANGANRFVTITNQRGEYFLPDAVDATWTVHIEMPGFATGEGPASMTSWDLKLLPFEEIQAEVVKADASVTSAPVQPASAKTNLRASADSGAPNPETAASSGLFDNLSAEDLNQRAMTGSLINGSIRNSADSPFAQPNAFGNNRFNRKFYTGNIGISFGDSGLDARPYSLLDPDEPKSSYRNYAVSFNFGGLLPISRSTFGKPYFFLHYEHKQDRNAFAAWGRMPSAAERTGDFSQSVDGSGQKVQLIDPATKAPLAGNLIPRHQISPQARSLLNLFPLPNADNTHANYQASILNRSRQDSFSLILDNRVSNSKHRLSGSFDFSRRRNFNHNLYGFLDTSQNSTFSADLNWQASITPAFLSQFRFHWTRQTSGLTPHFMDRINVSGNAGITGNNQETLNWGPPNLEFAGGISPLTDMPYARDRIQKSAFSHAGSWYNHQHNVTFGAGIEWNQFNLFRQQDARGTFIFTGAATGLDFADFLLGIPQTSTIAYGNADKYFRQKLLHAFVGDNWKAAHGFTINAGLRWEYEAPIHELQGRLANLDISPDFSSAAPVSGNNLIRPDRIGLGPRIGFAWRPGISSLIVRGSYGLYRNTNIYLSIALQMAQQSPFSKSMVAQYKRDNPLTMGDIFTAAGPAALNTFAVDPRFRVGYAQNWQLSLQDSLPAALQITLMYLGIKGTHLPQEFLPNTFPAGALSPSGYAYLSSHGNSMRHAAILQLRRRLRSGLAGNFQYTFARSIDNAPLLTGDRILNAAEGGSEIAQNWLDLSAERALSNFDQRHQVTAQIQYTSGVGVHGGTLVDGWKGALFKNWTMQWDLKSGSGLPQTAIYYAPLNGIGVIGNLRPDYTGASIQSSPSGLFLNPAAFRIPAPGHWGNAGRNTIPGPAQFELNASLGRTFRLKGKSLDMRVDATNVLNHVTFKSWNAIINNTQFGLPDSASPMRSLRLSMRLRFDNGLI